MPIILHISGAECTMLYDERLNLSSLGRQTITRASHVEPDGANQWWVDLSPVGGGHLGPFTQRSLALAAECVWLQAQLL